MSKYSCPFNGTTSRLREERIDGQLFYRCSFGKNVALAPIDQIYMQYLFTNHLYENFFGIKKVDNQLYFLFIHYLCKTVVDDDIHCFLTIVFFILALSHHSCFVCLCIAFNANELQIKKKKPLILR